MVKSRFSSLDVRAMVNSVRPEAVGCKLTNVYDINSKVYILKLSRRNFKRFLLLESGVRFHITDYQRDKSSVPSNYTMKLRKHIRTRRLTSIEQLGADRAVRFTFGRNENAFHLILELYVSGNLILTDHENRILALLRTHSDKENKVAMREVYPVNAAMGLLVPEPSEFQSAVEQILNKADTRRENQEEKALEEEDREAAKGKSKASAFAKKKRPEHMALPLFQVLHKVLPWADPPLCASCIASSAQAQGYEAADPFAINVDDMSFEDTVQVVQAAAASALEKLQSVSRPGDLGGGSMPVLGEPLGEEADDRDDDDDDDDDELPPAALVPPDETPPWEAPVVLGWIVRKRMHVPPAEPRWANHDFTPLPPDTDEGPEATVSFQSFHKCVDEFFVQLETHKAEEQKAQHAQSVYAKVERIRVDQGRRIEQLEAEQSVAERMAELIEANVELVERALAMLNAMVASQFDWGELWREVKRQQRLGHPIAQHIHSLELARNEVSLLLTSQPDDELDSGVVDGDAPMDVVPLDLGLSARANIARLHKDRKHTRAKTSKTQSQAEAAIKQAERKAQQDLQKYELKQTIRRVRQAWWFEKFIWFISSENYLVLAGRDAAQAELIFRRHVGPRDVLVHADIGGAPSCFVKSPDGREVPPATLREAGTAVLCRSVAWERHIVISPWWVFMEQVCRGKPPASGDFTVLSGGFFVQGQRKFLPPAHLEMGFALLFHVSGEGAAARHLGERKSRYIEAMCRATEVGGEALSGAAGTSSATAEAEVDTPCGLAPRDAQEEPVSHAPTAASSDEDHSSQPKRDVENAAVVDNEVDVDVDVDEAHDLEKAAEEGEEAEEGKEGEEGEEDEGGQGAVQAALAFPESTPSLRASRVAQRQSRKSTQRGAAAGAEVVMTSEDVAEEANEPSEAQPRSAPPEQPVAPPKPKSGTGPPKPLPRGQRGKQRKIREKYADQDEEERELRFALLGTKASKYAGSMAQGVDHPEQDWCEHSRVGGHNPKAVAPASAEHPQNLPLVQSEKHRGGTSRQKAPAQEEETCRPGCDADEASELQAGQLDVLTGQPHPDDDVLYAVPMVAPYCALSGPYTWRVKLTPGTVKKGQAVRTCLKMFEAQLSRVALKQLVQAIPEADAAGMMCGSCKLSMPGLQKLQSQVKREEKRHSKRREGDAAGCHQAA